MSEPFLSMRGVDFSFPRGAPVLQGISLEVRPGEVVALLGPNGAGKSTMLRLLSGALSPSAGEVRISGRPLASFDRRALAREVAVLPQESLVSLPYTVGEVVLMGRAPHVGRFSLEGDDDVRAAREALAAVDMEALADRPIDEVSGGERRRAALARVLAQEAPALLLDEPTAALDVRHQLDVFRLLGRLAREKGRAVVTATHDLSLAARHATRAVLMAGGTIRADGPPTHVLRPELLREVFEAEVHVIAHPRDGTPIVIFGE